MSPAPTMFLRLVWLTCKLPPQLNYWGKSARPDWEPPQNISIVYVTEEACNYWLHYLICTPEMARAMISLWISEVPSKIV